LPYPSNSDNAYNVTADELIQFYERLDQLEAEKKDISEQIKEVWAEFKGRGFDVKVARIHRKDRKLSADDRAERDAKLEMYKAALGDI
jgi:uncharacterized protein (UPF0335 family)